MESEWQDMDTDGTVHSFLIIVLLQITDLDQYIHSLGVSLPGRLAFPSTQIHPEEYVDSFPLRNSCSDFPCAQLLQQSPATLSVTLAN
jgi:hypothetical protein